MPSPNPILGVSLIFHILVNVCAFVYNSIVKLFKIPEINRVSKFIERTHSKEGDTRARLFSTYIVVFLVVCGIGTNAVVIVVLLAKNPNPSLLIPEAIKTVNAMGNAINFDQEKSTINPTTEILSKQTDTTQTQLSPPGLSTRHVTQSSPSYSMIDLSKILGNVNASFNSKTSIQPSPWLTDEALMLKRNSEENMLLLTRLKDKIAFVIKK